MPYYAKDEIARAREVDLLTYLQRCEPNELVHVGGNVYSTRTHDSLKISNGMWCWWSRGIGGKTALDYLIKVCSMTLPDAVAAIEGAPHGGAPAYAQKPQPPPAFTLPPKHADNRRVFSFPDLSDDERYYKMLEINEDYLDDERVNLDIQLSQPILVIGSLGLWNGRHSGYREIESGNIRDCLSARHDYTTWYVDRHGDLRCDDIHHDGTNHYLYRVFKDGVSEQQRDRLKSRIYSGVVTRSEITRLTRRLGDEIGKVYGWRFPQRTVSREAR